MSSKTNTGDDSGTKNAAKKHADTFGERSQVAAYISDHGIGTTDVEQTRIAGRQVTVSSPLTEDERDRVAEAIREVNPVEKGCFANAFQVWAHDSAFKFVEGYASIDDTPDYGFEHAWNSINGKLVDVTIDFDDYFGVVFEDNNLLSKYHQFAKETDVWTIIGNHKDRFAFLHECGYY